MVIDSLNLLDIISFKKNKGPFWYKYGRKKEIQGCLFNQYIYS